MDGDTPYKATTKAEPASEPTRPEATVLHMTAEARERFRQRRLVEAAKRVNPKDPGHTPKP